MANLKVVISCDEKGQYSVGPEAEEAEPSAEAAVAGPQAEAPEQESLQPVKSLDEALSVARDLFLKQDQVASAEQGEADMATGYAKGAGKPAGFQPRGM